MFGRSDGVLLGAVGLHRIDWCVRSLEVGYWCRTSAQRHGYVTEAVNEMLRVCFLVMNARRVEIRCDSGNERSARVAERCGLQLDGRLRNAALSPDGQVVDKLVFSMTVEDVLLTVTGDTTPLAPETYAGSRVLLHECTFLDRNEQLELEQRGHPHSALDDVLDLAVAANVGHLGLYHVSRRYEDQRILAVVRQQCALREVPFPVSVALPGRMYEDLLAQRVWQGTPDASSNDDE